MGPQYDEGQVVSRDDRGTTHVQPGCTASYPMNDGPRSPIMGEFSSLGSSLTELEKVLSVLEERLERVMSPDEPSTVAALGSDKREAPSGTSDVYGSVSHHRTTVEAVTHRISRVISRLEL